MFAKFRKKDAVFVIFCHKNFKFAIFATKMSPFQIPDDSENISDQVWVLLKIIRSGIGYLVPVRYWCLGANSGGKSRKRGQEVIFLHLEKFPHFPFVL